MLELNGFYFGVGGRVGMGVGNILIVKQEQLLHFVPDQTKRRKWKDRLPPKFDLNFSIYFFKYCLIVKL